MAEAAVALEPRWGQQSWMVEGLCAGRTELFFPPHAERPQARARREAQARVVCEACPALIECRTYAREHREYGFWGGESEEDRANAGFAVPWPIGMARRSRRG
ncbi:MAG: WhiB family transcriptional regulator [Acidimicrobiia bacterium]|nr:WhiB family transcriptional regulator [Acidimicrobiia bacterium]